MVVNMMHNLMCGTNETRRQDEGARVAGTSGAFTTELCQRVAMGWGNANALRRW